MAQDLPAPVADPTRIVFEASAATHGGRRILRLPDAASAALPSRGQVAVTGSMDGHPFETVVEPDGRRGHWIGLHDVVPMPPALAAGARVVVELAPAPTWPEPALPDDLRAALEAAPDVTERWESITPMARWEWVRWIRATRNPETRARRLEVAMSKLRSGTRRPCCFDLSACTDPDLSRSGKLIDADPEA